jgi:hypothetical protein
MRNDDNKQVAPMHRRHTRGSRIKARIRVEAQSGLVHMIIDKSDVVHDFTPAQA